MINSEIYFRNFESIDKEKKSILFIAGAGMDHRLVRSLKLPDSEFNKPLIIDLPDSVLVMSKFYGQLSLPRTLVNFLIKIRCSNPNPNRSTNYSVEDVS